MLSEALVGLCGTVDTDILGIMKLVRITQVFPLKASFIRAGVGQVWTLAIVY